MRKVLIIGYFWPYRSGSGRMLGLAKYLAEFGWEPIILTAPLERPVDPRLNVRVIETPYPGDIFSFWRRVFSLFGLRASRSMTEQIKAKLGASSASSFIERLRTLYQELFAYPDTEKRWRLPALKSAGAFLDNEPVDALLSVWPVTSHVIAHELKEHYRLPWAADFPDPWSENHAYAYGRIRKRFDRRLEQNTLATANALIAAAPTYAQKEQAVNHKDCQTILLGFDPEQMVKAPAKLTGKLTITYTGTIYWPNQDPLKLLDATRELLAEKKIAEGDIEVALYGANQEWLEEEIKKRGLDGLIKQRGLISREESISRQRESQILLAFGWEDRERLGGIPLKFFEYLAARRPILVTGGSEEEDFISLARELRAGRHAATVPEIKSVLLDFYQEYKERGEVAVGSSVSDVERFSYRVMARQFAEVLDSIA